MLIPTPVSRPNENILNARTIAQISADGSGTSVTTFSSSGTYKEEIKENLVGENKDDQRKFLIHNYGFKQPDEFEVTKNDSSGMFSTSIKMSIEQIPEFIAGNKMFLAPGLYKQWSQKLPKVKNRRLDFYFHNPFIKTDTTIFKLPEGYSIDALPASKNLICEYGSYKTSFWFDADKNSIYCTAKLELTQLKIPALKYASVKNFFDKVMQQESQKIVITK